MLVLMDKRLSISLSAMRCRNALFVSTHHVLMELEAMFSLCTSDKDSVNAVSESGPDRRD